MKNIILTPNPYRDKNFHTVREAMEVLKSAGANVRLCLPFDVDTNYELPKDLRFHKLDREMGYADAVICFGGDGTILGILTVTQREGRRPSLCRIRRRDYDRTGKDPQRRYLLAQRS